MTLFSLNDDHKELRRGILAFCRAELTEGAEERDRAGTFPRELWNKCGEMGLQGMPVPEEKGGLGLDPLSCAVALEALGRGCPDGGLLMALSAHLRSEVTGRRQPADSHSIDRAADGDQRGVQQIWCAVLRAPSVYCISAQLAPVVDRGSGQRVQR